MKIKINKTFGKNACQFEIEEPKDFDAMFKAGCIGSMPERCDCGSTDIYLASNKAKDYSFVKLICRACGKRCQMGQYRDGSGFYWKDWESYEGSRSGGEEKYIDVDEEARSTLEEMSIPKSERL